jgi:FkbM family methyltransferase
MREQIKKMAGEIRQIRRFAGVKASLLYMCAIARHRREIIRTGRLTSADEEMNCDTYNMRVHGTRVVVPGCYFGLARELYGRLCYFALRNFAISPGDVVVDLGANCGLFSVVAAKRLARVYALEAQSGFVKELQRIARMNNVNQSISIEWGLVGGGRGDFSFAESLSSASHWEGNIPPAFSLLELFEKHRLKRVDFLKVDIEGSEFDLFQSDKGVLDCIDKIAMEIHLIHGSAIEVVEPLQKAGFQTALLSADLVPMNELKTKIGYLFAWRT